MRATLFITLVITIAACVVFVFGYSEEKNLSMNTIVEGRGIPEHELILTEPTDTLYQQIMKQTNLRQANPNLDALKSYSVILKNDNDKALIAFQLKWEVEDNKGQITTTTRSYTNSRRLFDTRDKSKTQSVLEPSKTTFCSIIGILATDKFSEPQTGGLSFTMMPRGDKNQSQSLPPNKDSGSGVADLVSQLSVARKITVSIEGALFEDGLFVGQDSGNFYGWLESLINSRRDLAQELKTIKQNSNHQKVRDSLKKAEGDNPSVKFQRGLSSNDYYQFNKKRLAQRLLKLEGIAGYDAVYQQLEATDNHWLKLRRP